MKVNLYKIESRNKQIGLSAMAITYLVLITTLLLVGFWVYKNYSYSGDYLIAKDFSYPEQYPKACLDDNVKRAGNSLADHLLVKLDKNRTFTVTTPSNYRKDYTHPLLMVWAPSGFSENLSERFTGLTAQATEQGYIVVYARSIPLGKKALAQLATLVNEVTQTWCVDENRIFYTGHSDGGTVSNALAVMPDLPRRPTAIAPSAMGMQGQDMNEFPCPGPTPIMLMHNRNDSHFPNYGESVANWWAQCNRCSEIKIASAYPMCDTYQGCAAPTLFCQAEGGHGHWPGFEHQVLNFFNELKFMSSEEPEGSDLKP